MERQGLHRRRFLLASANAGLSFGLFSAAAGAAAAAAPDRDLTLPRSGSKPRNVILILTDDQRYDALGFMSAQSFPETPQLDSLAANGVHFRNAFVTTSLCSPSRATILTGQYAHEHGVVDNNHALAPELIFFPQYLQRAGYDTALIGKWHMGGDSAQPQRGFNHWVSFRGQGSYLPDEDGLNVNGRQVPQHGYITDELTDYALQWLRGRSPDRPFFLMLAHKAVHTPFTPAARHRGRYGRRVFREPRSMHLPQEQLSLLPMWMRNQRNSWHGVDFPYGTTLGLDEYFRRYAETLLAVDESTGAIVDHLRERGMLDSSVVIFMSDNGFAFGEHGLIDKRTAYEESMRIPLIVHCPELFDSGRHVGQIVANLDIAPTVLELAGLRPPPHFRGASFAALARGENLPWRDALLYEYYWERNFPQTPTVHALRGERYKYIRYHGLWDIDELFDLHGDAGEENNLVFSAGHARIVEAMNRRLFEQLQHSGGMQIPLRADAGRLFNLRSASGAAPADFPGQLLVRSGKPH